MNTLLLLVSLTLTPTTPLDVIAAPSIVCPIDPANMYLDQTEGL